MHSAAHLASSPQPRNGLAVVLCNGGIGFDVQTTHAVVDGGHDDGDVEVIGHVDRCVVEELLAIGVRGRVLGNRVVALEGLVKLCRRDAHVLGEVLPGGVVLHEATAAVVLAVPLDLFAGGSVEDKAVRALVVLVHFSCHVVATTELVDEPIALAVEENATAAAERLSGEELQLGVRLLWVHQTSWVHLHGLEIDHAGANFDSHFDAITSAVIAIGSGKVHNVRAVLLED
mmetsp:Transcript_22650/g.52790  ORF Transcript_22650/g.52790 Transcript_22650/m.52790 type:complete len:230 (+) Transcript_22650:625-1314(+)